MEKGTLNQASELVKGLFDRPENQERFKRIKTLQSSTGLSVGAIVLGYLINHPFPTFPIVGPKHNADLLDSIEAANATLSVKDLAFLTGRN